MSLKAEKSHKIEHREMYMLHRLDIQRLSGKKGRYPRACCGVPRPDHAPVVHGSQSSSDSEAVEWSCSSQWEDINTFGF